MTPVLTYLGDLMLKLTVVLVQTCDLIPHIGFDLLALMSYLLQTFVGPLKLILNAVETLR